MTSWKSRLGLIAVALVGCSPPTGGKITMVAASEVNDLSVTLTWSDGVTGEKSFSIERSELSATTGFNEVGSVMADATSFQDSSVQPLTIYWYRVVALFQGTMRVTSATVQVQTQKPILVPFQPTALATRPFSENDIELTWADNSNNEVGFEIERGGAMAGPFTKILTTAADAVKHTDTALTKDTTYFYRVRSVNTAGASAYTAVVGGKTYITNDSMPPTVPQGVTATASSSTSIDLSWTASTDTESGVATYKVFQSLGAAGSSVQVATVNSPMLSHVATLLGSGAMYCFTIQATDVVGNLSAMSSPAACATTPTTSTGPSAPTGLTAMTGSYRHLIVNFLDTAQNEQGFDLERSLTTTTGFARIAQLGALTDGGTRYSDDGGLMPSTVYFYRVRAFNDGGFSSFSNEASAATLVAPPALPTNFTAMVIDANRIRLAWLDNANNEDGYQIEQSTVSDGGGFAQITQTGANATNFTAQPQSPSTQYFFRIRGVNPGGNLGFVGPVNATTTGAPNAPTNGDAGTVAQTSMLLSWTDNAPDELGYRVERALAQNGPYTGLTKPDGGVPSTDPNVESYSATGLTANTLYFFRIRAQGDGGFSNASQIRRTTLP